MGTGGGEHFLIKLKKLYPAFAAMLVIWLWLTFKPQTRYAAFLRTCFIIVPLLTAFTNFAVYHFKYVQVKTKGGGFWQFYRAWVDMQNYARTHTSKDALILTPYNTDTGGFRIFSERKVLVCYRDCGIIGFDYAASVEWQKRIKDVDEFKMYSKENFERSLANALFKYKVDYIVFMNYYAPGGDTSFLKKMYQNEVLSLYEVQR